MEINLNEIHLSPFEELSSSFVYIETIASGAFGTVVLARNIKTSETVAIKILNKSLYKFDTSKLKEEITILKQLSHPNILKFYDYIETVNNIFIIMEYISKITLKTYITQNKLKLTEEKASTIMKYLLTAIQYIHSKNICHRDIKPENIMFKDMNDLSSLKLIDFGLSAQHNEYFMKPEICGTLIYMSPEQIENKTYTQGVDIWSAGIILYLLLNEGEHPFYEMNDSKKKYISKIKKGKYKTITKCSEMALRLLNVMLEPNPQLRISAQTVLKHPWITRNMFDNIPYNVIESLTRSSLQQKVQNIFICILFMKYYYKLNDKYINEEYEKNVEIINKEGKNFFRTRRINMFNVKHLMKDNYELNVKLSDNNEQETTHMNSTSSTSLVTSKLKQKNSFVNTKQKMYVVNTPKKIKNNEMHKTNGYSIIKRSYSTFEVKYTRNGKNVNINNMKGNINKKMRSSIISSPLRKNRFNDEYSIYHFQQTLRTNFTPIKTKTLYFHTKYKQSSIKEHSIKKEIQSPFSSKNKNKKKISLFQTASKKEMLYPLIIPNLKLKTEQHLTNKKLPL